MVLVQFLGSTADGSTHTFNYNKTLVMENLQTIDDDFVVMQQFHYHEHWILESISLRDCPQLSIYVDSAFNELELGEEASSPLPIVMATACECVEPERERERGRVGTASEGTAPSPERMTGSPFSRIA
ncbi:hypothetical protein F2P79_022031 [Pimephales promelas]|nr:hypothetical protein F2P79_022031 [Pimephales promelas]